MMVLAGLLVPLGVAQEVSKQRNSRKGNIDSKSSKNRPVELTRIAVMLDLQYYFSLVKHVARNIPIEFQENTIYLRCLSVHTTDESIHNIYIADIYQTPERIVCF